MIWGASGHARVVADAARLTGSITLAGFLDDEPSRKGEVFAQATVLGGRGILDELPAKGIGFLHVAIGHCPARMRLGEIAVGHGIQLFTIIHPSAVVAEDASIGVGSFLAAGAIVNSGAQVGHSVILNTASSVDHECMIGDGAHVGPGAHLGGRAQVGRGAWIGIGATLLDSVRVGEGAIIGGGSVVVHDIPDGVVAYGVPARVVRERRPDE